MFDVSRWIADQTIIDLVFGLVDPTNVLGSIACSLEIIDPEPVRKPVKRSCERCHS